MIMLTAETFRILISLWLHHSGFGLQTEELQSADPHVSDPGQQQKILPLDISFFVPLSIGVTLLAKAKEPIAKEAINPTNNKTNFIFFIFIICLGFIM